MYKHAGKTLFAIVLLVIAAITYVTISGVPYWHQGDVTKYFGGLSNVRTGIDINGGVDVTFSPPSNYTVKTGDIERAKNVLEKRLDDLSITDREVSADVQNHRIIVRFPWKASDTTHDAEAAIKELGTMKQLNFKDPDGKVIMTGTDVKNAVAKVGESGTQYAGQYLVELTLTADGQKKFATATAANVGKTITINMDETNISSPNVNEAIDSDTCIITGSKTAKEAADLANSINNGSLPFSLTTENYNSISPTLGKDALNVMLYALIIAFILICLFMIFYYRVPGIVACIALIGHVAGTVLLIILPGFTLTLPGIAGIILSIGMGVDCNIITAERVKEELRSGRTLDGSIDLGFDRSWTAILDGNVTVLIAGLILWLAGSATVKSFGYTLVIGVVFNFLMGIIASRMMLKSVSRFGAFRRPGFYGYKDLKGGSLWTNINFIAKRRVYYAISATLILVGILISLPFMSGIGLGVRMDIQFKGGTIIKYSYTGEIDIGKVKEEADKALGASTTVLNNVDLANTSKRQVVIELDQKVSSEKQEKLFEDMNTAFKDNKLAKYSSNTVDPQIGAQFFQRSILQVLLASFLIIVYIWIRFSKIGGLPAGLTAFASLVHDLLMVYAAFSIFRIPLNEGFIAVALTILGYSINDTIVIYDRIRENRALYGTKLHFSEIVNKSINQSFSRSINTSLVVFVSILIVVIFSVIFNLESIRNFAIPMLVGVVTGAYSTICIAGPLWTSWVEYKEKKNGTQHPGLSSGTGKNLKGKKTAAKPSLKGSAGNSSVKPV